MRLYLNKMTIDEIRDYLLKGNKVFEDGSCKCYAYDNQLKTINCCDFYADTVYEINTSIPTNSNLYFNLDAELILQKDHTYKTRNGEKAYIHAVNLDGEFVGVILGEASPFTWSSCGTYTGNNPDFDIVGAWE